jgi:hypothetical protein
VPRNRIVNGTFKAELDDGFIPSAEIKMHSVIGSGRNIPTIYQNIDYETDFSTKTTIGKKDRESTRFFC